MFRINIFLIITLLFFSFQVSAQDPGSGQYNLFKSKTFVKNPLDLRDPFKRKMNKKRTAIKNKEQTEGYYTNFNQSLEGKLIENLQVIGVVIGPERRAMIKEAGAGAKDNNVYYIKEGMKIGANGAEVKAILPGGIVLVEKIRNVYDQDEYLETVIPVSE